MCNPKSSGDSVGSYVDPDEDFNNTCRATDAMNNSVTCTFVVEVTDATPPVFVNCPNSTEVDADYGSSTAAVNWTEPTALDDVDGAVAVYSSDFPGDEFPAGNNTVTYYAVDAAGNAATCRFYVFVTLVGTTTPDPFAAGFGDGTPQPANESTNIVEDAVDDICLLYTSPSPRDRG